MSTDNMNRNTKLEYLNDNLIEYNKNKELITMYDEYINRIVELFDFIIKNNSDLFYSIVFDQLLHDGFFSADKTFEYHKNVQELIIKSGMNIVSGKGQCRNIACFYDDIFKKFFKYPLKMVCYLEEDLKDNENIDYFKQAGNHVINLTKYYGDIYGIDFTNRCFFTIGNDPYLEGIDVDYRLEYKANGDLLLNLVTLLNENTNVLRELFCNSRLFDQKRRKSQLTVDQINQITIRAIDLILQKEKLLNSFQTQNEELTHEIKKKMLLLK